MTKVSIAPVLGDGGFVYRAASGDKRSQGATAGEALDALAAQMPLGESSAFVVIGAMRPDRFFDFSQQQRLAELMARWRTARDTGQSLPADELAELQSLVEAELHASQKRSAALADELG